MHDYVCERMNMQGPTYSIRHGRSPTLGTWEIRSDPELPVAVSHSAPGQMRIVDWPFVRL